MSIFEESSGIERLSGVERPADTEGPAPTPDDRQEMLLRHLVSSKPSNSKPSSRHPHDDDECADIDGRPPELTRKQAAARLVAGSLIILAVLIVIGFIRLHR